MAYFLKKLGKKGNTISHSQSHPVYKIYMYTITIFEQVSKWSKTTTVYTVELLTSSQLHLWNAKTSAQKLPHNSGKEIASM